MHLSFLCIIIFLLVGLVRLLNVIILYVEEMDMILVTFDYSGLIYGNLIYGNL